MLYVATLISHSEQRAITDRIVKEATRVLPSGRFSVWLDQDIAADILFTLDDVEQIAGPKGVKAALADLARSAQEIAGDAPFDVVIQPDEQRRKKLLVADMDSTMIGQECIDELADFVGMKAHVAEITERAMRGEIAFEPALRERVGLLKGLSAQIIEKVIAERVRHTPGARTLVATMRANGAYTCLVSGGFTAFTDPIAAAIGFDESRGNTLLMDEVNLLTGLVSEPILGGEAKRAALVELRERRGLAREATLAVGDGANDLAMILEAGLGVAYRAKPAVAEAAHARIDHGDLTALLYLQGYRREEFVEA
ncbi:MAG TPA: phosphoserine phosphatase SerB [Xanthobacteraceae bacterium]|nr:phosphoserine phosphatase SerB [Xanthobacteraceae bacterium]